MPTPVFRSGASVLHLCYIFNLGSAEAGMTEGATAGVSPELGPLTSELDSVQGAAKWLVGAAASSLAVLVAGLQLSSVAEVASRGSVDLAVVAGLCTVAVGSVGTILVLAARVLVHPGWTPNLIAQESSNPDEWQKHWLSNALDARRGFLMPELVDSIPTGTTLSVAQIAEAAMRPALKVGRLYGHQQRLLQAWFELVELGEARFSGDLFDEGSTQVAVYRLRSSDDATRLQHRLTATAAAANRVASVANLLDVRRRYRRLVAGWLPVLGGLAVLSILALIWFVASNAQVPITAPVQVDIKFSNDAGALVENQIPGSCKGLTVRGAAINGSLSEPIVSSINDAHCVLNQAKVPPAAGTVVPVVPVK
ncbi:MAG: hypothetical protein JWO67_1321 [Streptosporangiaceae bacterium]|nr:hypothetical protein [Streptosporangiaceae bacterium]